MIEFTCPSCQALIRVVDGAGGKRGTCPGCKSKVVVPESSEAAGQSPQPGSESPPPSPPFEFKPAEDTSAPGAQDQSVTQDSVPDLDNTTAPLIDIKPEDTPGARVRRSRRRKKSSGRNLAVPLICAAILLAVVGWYFWQTQSGLSPDVVGEVVENPRIPDGLIAFGNVSVDKQTFDQVRQSLEEQPLSLVSSTHLADVTLGGNISGIVTKVEPVKGAVCVKVDLDGTKVDDYVSDRAKELNEYRMARIRETAHRFITEWSAAIDSGTREIPHLEDVRNDMALASVVSGFGYHVVAWDGKTASPCVGVDTSGDLYFFVKPGTKTFIIRGRELEGDTPGFPGEIVVKVPSTEKTPTKPARPSTPETSPDGDKAENRPEGTETEAEQDDTPESQDDDSVEENDNPPETE
jgi:hypothetical protein